MFQIEEGDKFLVQIPQYLRETQIGEELYKELLQWVNKFEREGLEFLFIDYYGVCWFRRRGEK